MQLYPHQKVGVDYCLDKRYSLNTSTPGTGKTLVALELIKQTTDTGLVVGPAFLKKNWEREAIAHDVDIVFISYTSLHKYKQDYLNAFKVWIADEFHRLKGVTTRQTQTYYKALKQARPDYFLGLSGTPIMNQVYDMWVPLAICSQCPWATNGLRLEGHLQKFRAFQYHFCNFQTMNLQGRRVDKFTGLKESRVEEFKALLKDKLISFKIEDVVKDLPSMVRKDVNLGLKKTPGLEEEFQAYMSGSKVDSTAKAASALLKAPSTAQYVQDILDAGESVVVFTDHIKSAHEIAKRIDGAVFITGATTAEARSHAVDLFQAGTLKCLVATIGSMSVGVTLTRARHVVVNDCSWTSANNDQAAARIHRIGQKDTTFAHFMYASDTDEHIARVLRAKQETIMRALT